MTNATYEYEHGKMPHNCVCQMSMMLSHIMPLIVTNCTTDGITDDHGMQKLSSKTFLDHQCDASHVICQMFLPNRLKSFIHFHLLKLH